MELASWIYPGIRPYVYEGGCDGSGLVINLTPLLLRLRFGFADHCARL